MTTAPALTPKPQEAPFAPMPVTVSDKLARLRRLRHDPLSYLLSLREEFGDLAYFQLWGLRSMMLSSPEHIHEMLVKKAHQFTRARTQTQIIGRLVGQSVLTTDGEFWRRQRKLLQPAFHHKRIAGYGAVMVNHALKQAAGWQSGQTLDIAHEMMSVTLGIVAETLFGADVSGTVDQVGQAAEMGQRAVTEQSFMFIPIPFWLPTRQNREMRRARKALDSVLMPIITERRKSQQDTGDLLSMLLLSVDDEDPTKRMSDEQVRNEAMTMFLAGHETTANALSWTWYLLAQHPAAEAKLHEELDRVLAGRSPTLEDLPQLPYTEMVIKEAMRLYPPAWIITRVAKEDTTIGGYRVPKGTITIASPYVSHRDPRYFPEPEKFDPERFHKVNEERLPRDAYMPFGDGPHICIGNMFAMLEARLILATLASRFQMRLVPGQKIEPVPLIALRPRDGIQVQLQARTPQVPKGRD